MRVEAGKFSYFEGGIKNITPTRTIESLSELVSIINSSVDLSGLYDTDKAAYKAAKEKLNYITPTGVYSVRNNAGIESVSRYFTIDIDADHLPEGMPAETAFEALKYCEYVRFMAYSPSGKGLWLLVEYNVNLVKNLVASGNTAGLEAKLKMIVETFGRLVLERQFGIHFDGCSGVLSQPRYIAKSKDVYVNENSSEWIDCMEETAELSVSNKKSNYVKENLEYTGDKKLDMQALFELADIAEERGVDIFSENLGTGYHDWQRTAIALAATYGEDGRILFERLSELRGPDTQAADIHKVEKKYNDALQNGRGDVSISTVFWLFKQSLGEDTFKSVLRKYRTDRGTLNAKAAMERTDVKDVVEKVKKVALDELRYDIASNEQLLAISSLLIKHLIDNNIVYCIDDTFFYKKNKYSWMPIDRTDGGGEDYITILTHLIAEGNGIKFKARTYANVIRPTIEILVRKLASKRIYEIAAENAGINLDNIMEYEPQYRIEHFMKDLEVDYNYSYTPYEVERLWIEFFAGIGNVLFKPLRTDSWIGADRVPVLVGKIGIGKTTFVRWFMKQVVDTVLPNNIGLNYMAQIENFDAHKRDVVVNMRDNLIILMDDVKEKALNSPEARQLITSAADRMRALFKSSSETFYRRAHFIATTNHKQIIREVQNNRRFFPIVLKANEETGYAFNRSPYFNALDLIIDALQIVEREYNGDFNKLKAELDSITVQVSKDFSSDGDVAEQIQAEYLLVDIDNLAYKAKKEGGKYSEILDKIKFTTMRELREELRLDKKTIDAAMQSLGIEMISKTIRVGEHVRRIYGYPIILRDAEFVVNTIDTVKAYELSDIFHEIGTNFVDIDNDVPF